MEDAWADRGDVVEDDASKERCGRPSGLAAGAPPWMRLQASCGLDATYRPLHYMSMRPHCSM